MFSKDTTQWRRDTSSSLALSPCGSSNTRRFRAFARKVLASLAGELPDTRRLVVTVHGPGYGLDEGEAFESQLAGFLDAIDSSDVPEQLETITFIERNEGRAKRLRGLLERIIPAGVLDHGRSILARCSGTGDV